MAVIRIDELAGSASNNAISVAFDGIEPGDLVIVGCGGGDKSEGIPTTSGQAPSQSSGSGATGGTAFTLIGTPGNDEPARISIYARVWTGSDTQVHLGTGWSGQGNNFVAICYRGHDVTAADIGTPSSANGISVGSVTGPNTSTAVDEPGISNLPADPGFCYVTFWCHERSVTFSSPAPTGVSGQPDFVEVAENSQSKGSLGSSEGGAGSQAWTIATTAIALSNSNTGKDSSSQGVAFAVAVAEGAAQDHIWPDPAGSEEDTLEVTDTLTTAVVSAHARSFTDTAEAPDTAVLNIDYRFTDPSEVLDTKTFTEDVIAHTFSETDTTEVLDTKTFTEDVTAHTFSETDTSEALDTKTFTEDVIAHTFSETDTTETLDTCVLNIDYSFTDSAEAEDTGTFDLVEAHVLSVTDTTETLDTSVLNIDYRFTDPSEAEDTKTFDSTAANTFSETDPAEALDTCVLNINYSFTDTSGSEDTLALDLGLVITDPAEAEDTGTFEAGTPHTRSFTDTAIEGPAAVSIITWGITLLNVSGLPGSYLKFEQLDQNFGRLDNLLIAFDSTETEDTGTFDETGINVFSKTDTLSTDDTLTLDISHSFTDTAEALDTRTFTEDVTAHTRSFTDTAEAPDTCVLNIAYGFTDTSEVLDTKTFDHTSVAAGETRSFTDTSEVLDTKTFTEDVVVYTRSFTDTAETLDTKTFTEDVIVYTRSFTDTATSDDTIVLNIDYSFTDTLEVEDTLTPVEDVDAFTETRTDTSEVLDSYVPGYGREPVETSGISDSLTLNLSIVVEDTSTVEDELSIVRAVNFSVTDTGEALDTLTAAHVYEDVLEAIDTLTTLLTIGLTSEIIGKGTITGQSPPELLTEGEALALIDIYNTSLNALGVGTLSATTDTSPQATILNNVWPSFRKQFLADYSWNGAKKSVVLSRLQDYTDTDVTPAGDRWSFAYVLPTDYLRVLRINGYERYNKTQRMLQNAFEIEVVNYADSASTTEDKRCLLTDEAGAINLEYIFDPGNDGIDLLGSKTTHALGLSLAHYVARNFGKTPQEIQVLADESRRAVSAAKGVDGQEKTQRLRSDMGLLESRYWWVG